MKRDKELIDEYKKLLQLEFPEDAAVLIIACEDEILKRMGAASPAEGPTQNAQPDPWKRVKWQWTEIEKLKAELKACAEKIRNQKTEINRLLAAGPKPSPRCPTKEQLQGFYREFWSEADAKDDQWNGDNMVEFFIDAFAQFFTPSAGEPQPHGKETK